MKYDGKRRQNAYNIIQHADVARAYEITPIKNCQSSHRQGAALLLAIDGWNAAESGDEIVSIRALVTKQARKSNSHARK
jgi:hypothetical protein